MESSALEARLAQVEARLALVERRPPAAGANAGAAPSAGHTDDANVSGGGRSQTTPSAKHTNYTCARVCLFLVTVAICVASLLTFGPTWEHSTGKSMIVCICGRPAKDWHNHTTGHVTGCRHTIHVCGHTTHTPHTTHL